MNTTGTWEIHCNASPDFTRKYGRKVKAVGGTYSVCRGYSEKRYVKIPNTPEGRKVADAVIREFGRYHGSGRKNSCVVISRGVVEPIYANPNITTKNWLDMSWVPVQYVPRGEGIDKAQEMVEKAAQQAVARGYVVGFEVAS